MLNEYLKLIWAYLKIGLFGFGGGYAMLSLIQREVVDSGWISSQMFTDIVAISQMTPGSPEPVHQRRLYGTTPGCCRTHRIGRPAADEQREFRL